MNKFNENLIDHCHFCNDRGFVIRKGLAYPCSCVEKKVKAKRFSQANLGWLQTQCTFENFSLKYYKGVGGQIGAHENYYKNAQIALNAAKEFAEKFSKGNYKGQGLLFTGSVGSGKTFLASAIANYCLNKNKQVLFTVVPDLLDEIKATYDRNNPNNIDESIILNQARTAELLILDDLGVHNYTDWTVNKIYSILNYKVNNQMPVIITTNLNLAELDTYLGERTTSRVLQLCKVYRLSNKEDIRYLKSREQN